MPVDFSDLSSEYIGILYEGLLDFELKTAPAEDPIIFLAIGQQPALPLSRLESMDDKSLAALLEKMKDTSEKDDGEAEDDAEDTPAEAETEADPADAEHPAGDDDEALEPSLTQDGPSDPRQEARARALRWATRAVLAGKLVTRPRGSLTPEKSRQQEEAIAAKAKQLVARVVLPHEWYLVRWGGTRKGSGTFYTRPGLAVPTALRTLRPLAYEQAPETANPAAPTPAEWVPRLPEEILSLKVCDPACGSGTFPVAALRTLTDALYASVHHHGRVAPRSQESCRTAQFC